MAVLGVFCILYACGSTAFLQGEAIFGGADPDCIVVLAVCTQTVVRGE